MHGRGSRVISETGEAYDVTEYKKLHFGYLVDLVKKMYFFL